MQGRATLSLDGEELVGWPGTQCVVHVRADRIFPNCPRYIHPMQRLEMSPHAPCENHEPPPAAWKRFEMFRDVLPKGDPAASDDAPST